MNQVTKKELLGVSISQVSFEGAVAAVGELISLDKQSLHPDELKHRYIVTINPEFIVQAQKDSQFRDILNHADLAVADGVGIKLAALILGWGNIERIAGVDLVERLFEEANRLGWRVFLLGGKQGSGELAAKMLKIRYPNLQAVGLFEGDGSETGDTETVPAVTVGGPIDLLLVAYGHPKQEKWIRRNLDKTQAKVAIGVGGTLDYLSGQKKRAPKWWRQSGFEWLYRLLHEPWRWQRQLALPKFVYLVFKKKLGN